MVAHIARPLSLLPEPPSSAPRAARVHRLSSRGSATGAGTPNGDRLNVGFESDPGIASGPKCAMSGHQVPSRNRTLACRDQEFGEIPPPVLRNIVPTRLC